MAIEKPPILSGTEREQLKALRDYLFRMAGSLEDAAAAAGTTQIQASLVTRPDGTKVYKKDADAAATTEAIRKNAQELKALIIKTANGLGDDIAAGDAAVSAYADQKIETYDSRYVAQSTFGSFAENINSVIETTARGVVESYGYESAIDSMQDGIDLLQSYYTSIDGEIRRGIVEDPDTGEYVLGIAISQNLQFSGACGPADPNNPGDGFTYYYLSSGQTFGLYTATGWQFWIDGYKKGWFSSVDGLLHVGSIQVENELLLGANWKAVTSIHVSGSNWCKIFEISYRGS